MNALAKYQNVILAVVIIAIAFAIYSYFFGGAEEAPLTAQNVAAAPQEDQDLISLLLELRSITLDEDIFADPTFQSLEDFSQELVPEPVGRPNPFAPLGASSQ